MRVQNLPLTLGVLLAAFALTASAQTKLQTITAASANQVVQFSVFLPLQNSSQLDDLIDQLHTPGSLNYQKWLSPQAFRQQFGAKPSDIAQVQSALAGYGLTVVSTNTHGLRMQGTVSAIKNAFGVNLANSAGTSGKPVLIATTPVKLPTALSQVGAHVVSFAPVAQHHAHGAPMTGSGPISANRFSPIGPYFFDDLKQAYLFPSAQVLNGAGRSIGIVDAGDFLDSDMALYFGFEGVTPPAITRVPIDGGSTFDFDTSAETSLDLQQAGGMALGAHLYLYLIPDLSDSSILDAYTAIVEGNTVDIVSSSFGLAEGLYTAAYNDGTDFTFIAQMFHDVFRHGNAQGITFVASSGDFAGLGLPSLSYFTATPQNPPVVAGTFLPGIEHPASDPNVTAVGGTNLVTTSNPPSLVSKYVRENANPDPLIPFDPYGVGNLASGGVWGSGSGASVIFHKPLYQVLANTHSQMRTIPDVSLMMGGCPSIAVQPCGPDRSFIVVALAGGFYGFVGTSVSAPGIAGVLALEEQQLNTRLGNVNYQIYFQSLFPLNFHTGIPGSNGIVSTTSFGYDPVLGARTPFVKDFVLAPFAASAGNPQTPSNP